MLQFFLGASGSLSGSISISIATNNASLVVDRPMTGSADIVFVTTASLKNLAALNASVAIVFDLPAAELITPLEEDGADEYRRRVIKTDVWAFPRRKIEQLH